MNKCISWLFSPTVRWLPRLILAAVFLAAGIPKLLHPHEFALAVFRYQMLPHSLVNLMAIYLPWMEMTAVAALLLPGRFRDAGVTLISGMLVMFTAAIAFNLWRGVDVSCGCFSVNPETGRIGTLSLLRNAALLLLCAWVWLGEWLPVLRNGSRGLS